MLFGRLLGRTHSWMQPGAVGTLLHLVRGEDWRALALFVEEAALGWCVARVRTKIQLVILLTTSSDLGTSRVATAVDVDDIVFSAVEVVILEVGDVAMGNAALSER
jgi:hypothetical protein